MTIARGVAAPSALLMALALVAAPVAAAPPRAAPTTKNSCLAAHEEAQALRTQKKPHAAREKFVACARAECPVVVRKECVEQLAVVEKEAPTVTLEARDESGNDAPNVQVTMDGRSIAERLTGTAFNVEPGEHVFRFERADKKSLEQRVLIVEGEKNRKVVVDFASLLPPKRHDEPGEAAPGAPAPEPRGIPVAAWISGGVALAAFGSFTFFALTGTSKENKLASSCGPRCTDDEIQPVKTSYLVADVSLAVGIVGTLFAVVLAWPAITGAPARTASLAAPPPWMPRVKVRVLP